MAYLEAISAELINVLKHACDARPERFAGHAANADFWIDEVRHCLDVIAGYDKRFKKLEAADPTIERASDYANRSHTKRLLLEQAKRFLMRCEKMRLLPPEHSGMLAGQIGLQTPL